MKNQYEISAEIFELYDIFHNSKSKVEFENCLTKIKSEKGKFDKNSYFTFRMHYSPTNK